MALTFMKKKPLTVDEVIKTANFLTKYDNYWDLKTHGVSQGMLMEFLACRKRAELSYKEGWTPSGTSNALTFGELFHSALESVYKHIKARKNVNNSVYLENVAKFVLKEYKERINKERVWTVEDEQDHQMNAGYLHILLPAYIHNYLKKDEKQEWLIVEDEFQNRFEIETKDFFADPVLKGRYDQVYRNRHGEVWIKEIKTKSRIDPTIQDRLSFDFQTMFYILNYWLEFKIMPAGFVYDIIQRPGLRKGAAESLERFMGRVKSDVDSSYFQRIRMSLTKADLDKWIENDFNPIIREFYDWATGSLPTYRNPASCETRYGVCKFLRVCGLKDFTGLYRKPHTPLIEKKGESV